MRRALVLLATTGWLAAAGAGAYAILGKPPLRQAEASQSAPAPEFASGGYAVGDAANGFAKAAACAGCHGPAGVSVNEHYPQLAGQRRAYLAQQMRDFRSGERDNDAAMASFARPLTDQDIADLATYFSCLSADGAEPDEGLSSCP